MAARDAASRGRAVRAPSATPPTGDGVDLTPFDGGAQPLEGGERLNLLSCNILAGGSVQSYRDYVTGGLRQVLPTGRQANLDDFARLLAPFDVVALQEADEGSLRSGFMHQTRYLAEVAEFPYWSHQPNRRVARLAASGNGLLARWQPNEIRDYPLPGRIPGRGALWARFGKGADSLVVVVAHLSLGAAARAGQLAFLAELLEGHPNSVLMGDFNTSVQGRELDRLYARTTLVRPEASPATFPSWRPRRALDQILVSSPIIVDRRWVLDHAVSDHLPIAATIRLPHRLATSG